MPDIADAVVELPEPVAASVAGIVFAAPGVRTVVAEEEDDRVLVLAGVLSGSRSEVYGADDLVGGEMQNGKWMRQGDFKAASVAPPYGPGTWELYNLAEDPGETQDLANEKRDTLDRLIEAWNRYADDVGVVLTSQ